MSETKNKNLHYVSVQTAPVVLHKDIKKKIAEIRIKRDAIMLAHNRVNIQQDKYNKVIICLSLFSAFFESTKAQLNLATRDDWVAPVSILMPILLSTILSIISSLMKFKKFNERIDLLSKATEKSNATVLSLRRLQESLNFQSYIQSYKDYSGPVTENYRDALDCYERALYPQEHDKYMKEAIKLAENSKEYKEIFNKNIEITLNKEQAERQQNPVTYPNNIQLDSPDANDSTNIENEIVTEEIKINIKEKEPEDPKDPEENEKQETSTTNEVSDTPSNSIKKPQSKVMEMTNIYKSQDATSNDKQNLKPT